MRGGGIDQTDSFFFFCSLLFLSVVVALPVSLVLFLPSLSVYIFFLSLAWSSAVHFSIFPRLPKTLVFKNS